MLSPSAFGHLIGSCKWPFVASTAKSSLSHKRARPVRRGDASAFGSTLSDNAVNGTPPRDGGSSPELNHPDEGQTHVRLPPFTPPDALRSVRYCGVVLVMGVHPNIGFEKFPKQGSCAGQPVSVCFNYDTSKRILGKFVRDDAEAPFMAIIQLDDGRFILATECQYQPLSFAIPEGSA